MAKIAVFLSVCLVCPPLLFAQNAPTAQDSLLQYQAQARQDVEKNPWIKNEGFWVLGTFGIAATTLIVQQVRHQAKLKNIEKQQTIQRLTSAQANRELAQARSRIGALENQNSHLNNINHDLLQGREYFKTEMADMQAKLNSEKFVTQSLRQREAALRMDLAEWEFLELNGLDKIEKQAKPIAKKLLQGQTLTEAELKILLEGTDPSVAREITQVLQHRHPGNVSMQTAIQNIARANPEKISYKSIRFLQKIFREIKTPLALGLLLSLSINTHTAQAQDWANRLNHNFDLFLQASAQELAEIERLGLSALCIEGAQAIHEMSALDETSQKEMQAAAQPAPRDWQTLKNLSAY